MRALGGIPWVGTSKLDRMELNVDWDVSRVSRVDHLHEIVDSCFLESSHHALFVEMATDELKMVEKTFTARTKEAHSDMLVSTASLCLVSMTVVRESVQEGDIKSPQGLFIAPVLNATQVERYLLGEPRFLTRTEWQEFDDFLVILDALIRKGDF